MTPTLDEMIFLLRQLDTIEHARDEKKILGIAKKYDIYTVANHKGRLGKPKCNGKHKY